MMALTPNDLRQYAEWLEQHPEAAPADVVLSSYGMGADKVRLLLESDAELIPLSPRDEIVYVNQTFGALTIRHVVRKEKVMEPAIVDGKITWKLRPEFVLAEVR